MLILPGGNYDSCNLRCEIPDVLDEGNPKGSNKITPKMILDGGLPRFFIFAPNLGEMIQFD